VPVVALRNHELYAPLAASATDAGVRVSALEETIRRVLGAAQQTRVLTGTCALGPMDARERQRQRQRESVCVCVEGWGARLIEPRHGWQ
jgi:hypothetical protein